MNQSKIPALFAAIVAVCAATMVIADTMPTENAGSAPSVSSGKKMVDPRLADQTIVCKHEDATGSRLGAKTICYSRGEWAAMAADARQSMDRIQTSPQVR